MRSIKTIKNIKGKTALVRVDFNVPIKDGKVEDDFRIRKALPTINFLIKKGAQIILITHLGKDGTASLEPVIKHFFKISKLSKSKVEFFENVRKFSGEMDNNVHFERNLSRLGDFYVNEAFSVSHRAHTSIVGIPKHLPSYAGFQMEEEIKNLLKAIKNPKHPFLFILGGAKFSTKMPLIKKYLKLADYVFIGGALLDDFLKAEGFEVGKSLVDDSKGIKEILKNKKLILPTDVVVKSGDKLINKKSNEVKKDEIILDVGTESVKLLEPLIKKSKLILWNGPLGKYETKGGDKATKEILKTVIKSKAQVIIGGGDLVEVLSTLKAKSYKLKPNMFVSTGGGATLDFLANGTLPGIKALG
ncbi:MAG: phosphoglycerate kinase [Candidatus Paceibacterota bacterium]|jgi:phosphoglycerate kinase